VGATAELILKLWSEGKPRGLKAKQRNDAKGTQPKVTCPDSHAETSMTDSARAVSPAKGAALCGISRTKFYELLNKEIPIRKVERRTLILVADIDQWLSSLPVNVGKNAT
jgi:hypothetical protein